MFQCDSDDIGFSLAVESANRVDSVFLALRSVAATARAAPRLPNAARTIAIYGGMVSEDLNQVILERESGDYVWRLICVGRHNPKPELFSPAGHEGDKWTLE